MTRAGAFAWRAAVVVGYLSRPWSCGEALSREVRPDGDPYHSIDPHGFGLMGAFFAALLLAGPVFALLLQQRGPERRAARRGGREWGRDGSALAVLGSPMLLQLTYLRLPFAAAWPVAASSAAWLALVASAVLNTGARGPSLSAAFDRRPAIAWATLAAIAALKLGFLGYALTV